MKTGSEMAARQALHTDLNRRRDLTGSRARISITRISSISCGGARRGARALLFLLAPVFFVDFMAEMRRRRKVYD
jgi:hypothetical protein